jgi:hypothetical protein
VSLQGGKTAPAEGKNITQGANKIETIKKTSSQRLKSEITRVFPQPVKPIVLASFMYGLKPVPFEPESFSAA